MTVFIIRRMLQALLVVCLMSVIVFFGVNIVGDPIYMLVSPDADQADIEAAIARLGLDRPIWEQYVLFLKGAAQGDLGDSFIFGESALKLILHHMPATMELAFSALILAIVIGIPLGLYAGLYPDSRRSKGIMAASILGFSLPTFWVGLMLIMLFAVELRWVPATGRGDLGSFLGIQSSLLTPDGLSHIFLPALNLALLKISLAIRLTRAGVREAMGQDYVKYARAKGLSTRRIILVHVMKNIMIPVVTVMGLEFGSLIGFSVVTETIFAWPGMGKLLIDAILQLDRPVVVAYLMIIVLFFVLINLIVDIIYSILDPRVRLQDQGA
ncbi:MAG: ABC transporter permease [Rhodobacteraceae bacterium]|jgi:peptide/nickel transport system permease protein|nr:ABC transporter permease [Paracoccaceae bacterium]NCV29539.1 ABC transporter permease [Paracoccaceae bacterium]NCV66436.1 ABC transporter permease [Paracoccaceae bacterium]NCW03356.1 ABC transporter permease [Paracoccaceae bacterium]NCW60502.1 ABC transporter permease [Paracoccaceae bacterium]